MAYADQLGSNQQVEGLLQSTQQDLWSAPVSGTQNDNDDSEGA